MELPLLLSYVQSNELMALDFETKGDYADVDSRPVGIGLATRAGSVYIDLTNSHPDTLRILAS